MYNLKLSFTIDNWGHGENCPVLVIYNWINRFILDNSQVRSKVTFFLKVDKKH